MSYKFFVAFLIVALSLLLQVALGETSGFWINFSLAALITAAFFVNFLEIVVLILFTILILNSQPTFNLEMLIFSLLPVKIFLIRQFIPLKPLLGNLAAIFFAVLIFYLIFGAQFFIAEPHIFFLDALGSLIFGLIAFKLLEASA